MYVEHLALIEIQVIVRMYNAQHFAYHANLLFGFSVLAPYFKYAKNVE